ncbi:M61 family metallopeptidase [Marinoscillum sp.]|uniref:M61 family metallopeptidase n=1 Tax=Marinoscillum sp. TaxID=2024838 RepID=UPI003BAA65BF
MRLFGLLLLSLLATGQLFSQDITYTLDLSNSQHHELKISILFTELEGESLEIRMPNSSPGRYALHNFAKNVYEEQAFDGAGNEVELVRLTPFTWEMPVTNGKARFDYTIYGNHADGTYLGVDAKKLHMNMPATFAYGTGLEDRKINLVIPKKEGWSVATQLVKENETTYSAPNYYYFYDSPTMVGKIDWREWQVDGQTIQLAMMHEGTNQELDDYTEWVKKVVAEQQSIYGELPSFDYGRYTFLVAYNPWVDGDGMEHRNSTVCTSTGSLEKNASGLIGTISHEFFHAWNIERIRPKSLEPFDFDQANLSEALWFGEGFTSYFDDLSLTRAGIYSPEQYVNSLVGGLNYVLNSPSREFRGPIKMSYNATFVDAGTANDATNYSNNFVSYYSYGSVIGLGLDLTLRVEFNKTLDEYMRMVWEQYGKPEIPYTMENLEDVLAQLTNKNFAETFFKEQIQGSKIPDFDALFEEFGIKMSLQNPNSAYFANPKINDNNQVQSTVMRGTAFYEAGIEQGDKIISVNGTTINTTADLNREINAMEIGKTYAIEYEQLGEVKTGSFTAKQDPRIMLSYLSDDKLSKKIVKRRNEWLEIK